MLKIPGGFSATNVSRELIFPYLYGHSEPASFDQRPPKCVIPFSDWHVDVYWANGYFYYRVTPPPQHLLHYPYVVVWPPPGGIPKTAVVEIASYVPPQLTTPRTTRY